MIRAFRKGYIEWHASDAGRIRKEQFRNQHFRADFILAYSQTDTAEVSKLVPGSYGFLRRRVSNISCIGSEGGAAIFNFACAAEGIFGAIHGGLSEKYENQITALKDTLDYYDGLGLGGLNREARDST